MFVLQNAWSAIKEHPWRTIGITILAVLVSGCTVTGMAITQGATAAQTTGYNALKPLVTMSLDRKAVMQQEHAKQASDVDWSKYQMSLTKFVKYAAVSNVQFTSAYYSETVTLQSIENAKLPSDSKQITLTGFSEKSALDDSPNGAITIVQGKTLTYDTSSAGQVLVPEALAKANGWKVGDKIQIVAKQGESASETTIQGIYRNTTTVNQQETGLDPNTAIYGSYYELAQLGLESQSDDPTDYALTITVGASNPSDAKKYISSLESQFKKDKLAHYIIVSPTLENYQSKIASLKKAGSIAHIALPVALGIAAILLILVLLVTWRGANEEIGLQMLLGRAKFGIAWQFFMSIAPSMVLGWIIGGLAFGFATQPLVKALGIGDSVAPNVSIIGTTIWFGVLALAGILVLAWVRTWFVTKSAVVSARIEQSDTYRAEVEHE